MEADEKKCPQCAEIVKAEAKICRFCGHSFENTPPNVSTVVEDQPETKKGKLGRGCLILLGVFVALAIVGSLADPGGDNQGVGQASDPISGEVQDGTGDAESVNDESIGLFGPKANAARSAKQYLAISGFSRQGLIEQLSSDAGEGYDIADATAAVDSLSVNWNEQAARSAQQYLQITGFSCNGLIEQLSSNAGEGYTASEARYGAEQAGAC